MIGNESIVTHGFAGVSPILLHVSTVPPRSMWDWDWRSGVILVLLVSAILYMFGWLRLRQTGQRRLASGYRLLAYLAGLLTIAIALMSSIDLLQPFLLSVHMIQHELLMFLAPPLILAGRPMPFVLWGLPASARKPLARFLVRDAIARRGLAFVVNPWVAFVLSTAILWLWHLPAAYNAALATNTIHDLEHISFFVAFVLYWWPLIGAPPEPARLTGNAQRGLYLLAGATQIDILGALITLSDHVLYSHYLTMPRLTGLSALDDQRLAGAIMWFPGPLIFGLAAALSMRDEPEQAVQQA
jgi:cytochrome c oxidase assembly factor CtaG